MQELRLKLFNRQTGLVLRPDSDYPELWRIHYQDRISDMVNLSRAKDAALLWAR